MMTLLDHHYMCTSVCSSRIVVIISIKHFHNRISFLKSYQKLFEVCVFWVILPILFHIIKLCFQYPRFVVPKVWHLMFVHNEISGLVSAHQPTYRAKHAAAAMRPHTSVKQKTQLRTNRHDLFQLSTETDELHFQALVASTGSTKRASDIYRYDQLQLAGWFLF